MPDPTTVFLNAAADQAASQVFNDLMVHAASFDGVEFNLATLGLSSRLNTDPEITREGLASAVALLAMKMHRDGAR